MHKNANVLIVTVPYEIATTYRSSSIFRKINEIGGGMYTVVAGIARVAAVRPSHWKDAIVNPISRKFVFSINDSLVLPPGQRAVVLPILRKYGKIFLVHVVTK